MFLQARQQIQERHVVVDHNLCFFCGACVAVCPPDSIFLDNTYLKIDDETCTRCERCVRMCPVHALTMKRSGSNGKSTVGAALNRAKRCP